jgi:hypothetical protein
VKVDSRKGNANTNQEERKERKNKIKKIGEMSDKTLINSKIR